VIQGPAIGSYPDHDESNPKPQTLFLRHNLLLPLHLLMQGFGQNNGNTTDTVHISLLILFRTTFCLQYSRIPTWSGLVQVSNSL
jgi:hypothetical protein